MNVTSLNLDRRRVPKGWLTLAGARQHDLLGLEGDDAGGHILAEGTPEQVAEVEASYTGRFVKRLLKTEVEDALRS